MTELSYSTEAAVVAEIAREADRFNQSHTPDANAVHVNVLQDRERVEHAVFEMYDRVPRRARGTTTVTDVASFAALMSMQEHRGSVIFACKASRLVTAVIDYHGWRDHRVQLDLHHSEPYIHWSGRDGMLFTQSEFAELIQTSLSDIADPPAADMLELTQNFQATRAVDYEAGQRQSSGAIRFRYTERIDARAGELSVPEAFTLHLPIFHGGKTIALQANLRYRITKDGLLLGFKIPQLNQVVNAAFDVVVDEVTQALEVDQHTIVRGPAPTRIDAFR